MNQVSNWIELNDKEYSQVWNEFYARFRFRPSMSSFPGIEEPFGSITWSIDRPFENLNSDQLLDNFNEILRSGLQKLCSDQSAFVYALDWQHTCYRYYPLALSEKHRMPISFFPDGDYSIFLLPDMTSGYFAHPWEQTICVFGNHLIQLVETELNLLLGVAIRSKK